MANLLLHKIPPGRAECHPSIALYCDRARADHAQSIPRRPPPPELPAVPDRPDAVADRHVDADDGGGVARARADEQRVPRRPRRRGVVAPDPALLAARRRHRRPRRTSCASCASRRSRFLVEASLALVAHGRRIASTIDWLLVARVRQRPHRVDRDSGAPVAGASTSSGATICPTRSRSTRAASISRASSGPASPRSSSPDSASRGASA